MSATHQILSAAFLAVQQHNPDFANFVPVNPSDELFRALKYDGPSPRGIVATVGAPYGIDKSHPKVVPFFSEFLNFVRLYDEEVPSEFRLDARFGRKELRNYEYLAKAYEHAVGVFQQRGTGWFVLVLQKLTFALVHLAGNADRAANDLKKRCSADAAKFISRAFSVAALDRGTERPDKRDATLSLANLLFKLYFENNSMRLCDTVLKNVSQQKERLPEFPTADQCMFHFWLGRILLAKRRLRDAYNELMMSFMMCSNRSFRNRRIILSHLIGTALPLSIFPSLALLSYYKLADIYQPIINAIKLGDIYTLHLEIDRRRSWLAYRGLYIILLEKLEVLAWRTLMRRTILIKRQIRPNAEASSPPTLVFHEILTVARVSTRDLSYTIADVESMCCTLIDQGYIIGYILHSASSLVLKKETKFGFPPASAVTVTVGTIAPEEEVGADEESMME